MGLSPSFVRSPTGVLMPSPSSSSNYTWVRGPCAMGNMHPLPLLRTSDCTRAQTPQQDRRFLAVPQACQHLTLSHFICHMDDQSPQHYVWKKAPSSTELQHQLCRKWSFYTRSVCFHILYSVPWFIFFFSPWSICPTFCHYCTILNALPLE